MVEIDASGRIRTTSSLAGDVEKPKMMHSKRGQTIVAVVAALISAVVCGNPLQLLAASGSSGEADQLTKDQSRWRLIKAEARVYADLKEIPEVRRYEEEKRFTKLNRMAFERRSFRFPSSVKAELLQEAGEDGMAKIRYFSKARNETNDVWIASTDVLPYDAEVHRGSSGERDAKAREVHAKKEERGKWLGKSVEIAEKALAFRDIDALWEMIEARQTKRAPSAETTERWAKQSQVLLPGKESYGFVVSTEEPFGYLQVASRMNGKDIRLWVSEKDLTEVQLGDSPSAVASEDARPGRVSDAVQKTSDGSGQSSSDLPEIPFASTEELLRSRPSTAAPDRAEKTTDKRLSQFSKFRLGDYTYQIKDCELRDRLGSKYLSYTKPGAGAVFLLVRFGIENETNKTATVLSDDFTLRDAKGREFRPASKALTALMMEEENKDFLLTEVQPGIEKESVTAFEIPQTALSGDLILIVPEKGILGSKTIEVLIKPKTRKGPNS